MFIWCDFSAIIGLEKPRIFCGFLGNTHEILKTCFHAISDRRYTTLQHSDNSTHTEASVGFGHFVQGYGGMASIAFTKTFYSISGVWLLYHWVGVWWGLGELWKPIVWFHQLPSYRRLATEVFLNNEMFLKILYLALCLSKLSLLTLKLCQKFSGYFKQKHYIILPNQ